MTAGVSRAVIEVILDRVSQGAATLSPQGELTYINQPAARQDARRHARPARRQAAPPAGGRGRPREPRHGQASCLVTDLSQAKNGAGLAHEVRNMLGTVHNSVAVLKHSPLDANGQRALAALERQSARILELLNPAE